MTARDIDERADHRCGTAEGPPRLPSRGTKPGIAYGKTDDFSYNIVEDPVEVHDLNATMLYLLGIDHKQLTFHYQGRDFRLTDNGGKVIQEIIA